jgi:hypothetical protein
MKFDISHATAAALLVLGAAGSPPARADLISFNLTNGDAAIGGFFDPGPYVRVTVNLTAPNSATLTFVSLTDPEAIFLMGVQGAVAVNVNAASWNLGTVTGSNAGTGFITPSFTNAGAGSEDSFGTFNQRINSNGTVTEDGYPWSSDHISFALTDTSGTWASASDVLIGNADGHFAAAHIFDSGNPAVASAGSGRVPLAFATDAVAAAPEPATVALLGSGLLGFALIRHRRE